MQSTTESPSRPNAVSTETNAKRPLNALEEFFWLHEQRFSKLAVLVGEIEGETSLTQWQDAVHRVYRRNPSLAASIRKARGARPHFYASDEPLFFRVFPLTAEFSVEREMGSRLYIL